MRVLLTGFSTRKFTFVIILLYSSLNFVSGSASDGDGGSPFPLSRGAPSTALDRLAAGAPSVLRR